MQSTKWIPLAAALAAAAIGPAPVRAQDGSPRADLLVSAAWLAEHLHDPTLVILQAGAMGNEEIYNAGHIPGARMLDYGVVYALPKGDAPLAAGHDALERLGVSDNSRIVLYSADGYVAPATRALLLLNYAGLPRVQLLDGGLKGWTASGGALSKDAPLARKGTLSPFTPQPALIADADFVTAHKRTAGFAIVDARNREFYDGTKEGGPRDHRVKGHIPGALSAPFDAFTNGDGHLKSASEIAAVFDRAGVKPGDTIIGYCHVGEQATAMLFAARTIGHRVVLYNGSFADWVQRGLPLELPKQEK